MSRPTEIRDNLEDLQTKLKSCEENGKLIKSNCMGEDFVYWKFPSENMLAYHEMMSERFDTTKTENIKEAKSMIFELEEHKRFLKSLPIQSKNVSMRIYERISEIEKEIKDWQNLLNWLEGLK